MQFCLGYHKQPPGAIQTHLNFFMHFSSQMYQFLSHITLITKWPPIWNLETQTFPMIVFCQDYKKLWFYKTVIHLEYDPSTKGGAR